MSTNEKKYCERCAPNGKLRSKEDIQKGWVNFFLSQGMTIEDAEKKVSEQMSIMPAWKKS
jgi:hypothetical protein